MLIVGREVGQSVIIGDTVKVTVLQKGTQLHLVIDAPRNIKISNVKQSPKSIEKMQSRNRKVGETVLIGDVVKVSILQTKSGLLRFAIDAPKEISVFREEIYDPKKREKSYLRSNNFHFFDSSEQNYVSL